MERLRVGILAPQPARLEALLAAAGIETIGVQDGRAEDPHVVLVEYTAFTEGLGHAVAHVRRRIPEAALVLMGPPLEAPALLEAIRWGVREVLIAPSDAELLEALERLRQGRPAPRRRRHDRRPGEVIVVHSPKGGAGASSLALNLACQLRGKRGAVLVDLCLQTGDLDLMLNLKPPSTWADLVACAELGPDELERALMTYWQGVRLLAAPPRLEEAERIAGPLVEGVLEALRRRCAHVVIDTPAALTEGSLRAMELADRILVPTALTMTSLRQVQRGLRLWPELGIPGSKVEIVAWGPRGDLTLADAERILQCEVRHRLPYDPKGIERAINLGEALVRIQPSGPYARAVAEIARLRKRPVSGPRGGRWFQQLIGPTRRHGDVPAPQA